MTATRTDTIATLATARPATYAWEATDAEIAARYGIARDGILRFDLNTAPSAPTLAAEVLARGGFEPVLSEYPASDYGDLVEAAAGAYGVEPDEILVGAGADEILDVLAKTFLPPGETAVIPIPTYAMFRVVTEQRGGVVRAVPRRPASEGWAIDLDAVIDAAADADLVWLCSPNNPTALAEPEGTIASLLETLSRRAREAGASIPIVVLDEAYAEFVGASLVELRLRHSNLIVVRTASKAYGLAGFRVGFAVAASSTIARIAPYRPPASIATVSAAVVEAALRDGSEMRAEVARVGRERDRLTGELEAAGWSVEPSVTNFVLAGFGTASRAASVAEELLRRGMVPRMFGEAHPLAAFLRLTVRDVEGDDRLISAARELGR